MKVCLRLLIILIIGITSLALPAFTKETTELEAYKEEAKWHYQMAKEVLQEKGDRENKVKEAIRILHEIIDCYDEDYLEAYLLLIDIYREQKDEEKLKLIEERYQKRLSVQKELQAKEEQIVDYYTGEEEKEEINQLIKRLSLPDAQERNKAAEMLVEKGSIVVPALIRALKSQDLNLISMSAYILGKIGDKEAFVPLKDLLINKAPPERVAAAKALGELGDERAVPYLISAFSDPYFSHYHDKFEVREAAADSLAKYKELALPHLLKAAKSKDEAARWFAIETLRRIGSYTEEVVDLLLAMNDKSDNVKLSAIKAFSEIKKEGIVPGLIGALKSKNPEVRYFAVTALARIGDITTTKPLISSLKDPDKQVVNEAIKALAKIGDKEATEPILNIAMDESRDVTTRWYAITSLGHLLSDDGMPALRKALDDENIYIRSAAAIALSLPLVKEEDIDALAEKKEEALLSLGLKFALASSEHTYEEARKASIKKGLEFLASKQNEDGHFQSNFFPLGVTQMAILCFLKEGFSEDDPVVKKGLEYMLAHEQADGSYLSVSEEERKKVSYDVSLAIMVLVATENPKYEDRTRRSLKWLIELQDRTGGFGYLKGERPDMSSTEFALLALEKAYNYLGLEKQDEVWIKALDYLTGQQHPDGGFGYIKEKGEHSYGSMTAAGLTGLRLCNISLSDSKTKGALDWISKHYTLEENPEGLPKHYEYYLRALATALHLTGLSSITDKDGLAHNWHQEIINKLIREQNEDGFWVTDKEALFTTYFIDVLQLKEMEKSLMKEGEPQF